MSHPWSMQLSLRLDEHGWSDLDLWVENRHYEFCVTHIFNSPVEEIAGALLSLQQGSANVQFTLHEEPGRHEWQMTQIADAHHLLLVEVRTYEANFPKGVPAIEVFDFRVAREFFISSLMAELDKIAMQLGFPAFAENRDSGTFPWSIWRELQSHRKPNSCRTPNGLP